MALNVQFYKIHNYLTNEDIVIPRLINQQTLEFYPLCEYHFIVRRDGTIETGRPVEQVGAHCQYHNKYSIGICYEGGLDEDGKPADTRTEEQKAALSALVDNLRERFPRAIALGHHDLNPMKACPCFDVVKEFK